MTIRLVEIVSGGYSSLQLPLQDPSQGYYIQEIEGLTPVEASIVTTKTATRNGVQYQASSQEGRSIVLHLGLDPDYISNTAASLRRALYARLMPGREVTLRFTMDNHPIVEIVGRVESFQAAIFSQDTDSVVSILCMDPDFISTTLTSFSGNSTSGTTDSVITNNGDVPVGFLFTLAVNRTITEFSIVHSGADNVLHNMDFAAPLLAGDILEINTIPGQKGAWMTRGTARASVLYGVSPESPYFQLQPGANNFRTKIAGATIPYTVRYTERFGGL